MGFPIRLSTVVGLSLTLLGLETRQLTLVSSETYGTRALLGLLCMKKDYLEMGGGAKGLRWDK